MHWIDIIQNAILEKLINLSFRGSGTVEEPRKSIINAIPKWSE